MKELEKTYNPADIEDRLYQKWLDGKYFHAEVNRSLQRAAALPIVGQLPHPARRSDCRRHPIITQKNSPVLYTGLHEPCQPARRPANRHARMATTKKTIPAMRVVLASI